MERKAVVLALALAAGLVLLDRKAKSSTAPATWRPGGFLGPPVRGGGCGCHS